jgi:putative aminopeptidase FrvX
MIKGVKTKNLVQEIFSQPTAPFREGWVLQKIIQILENAKVPFFEDDFGNIIAGCKNAAQAKKAKMAFMAHTDHPGFHVNSQKGRSVEAVWFGGAPFKTMKGAKVRIHNPMAPGQSTTGRISFVSQVISRHEGIQIRIRLDKNAEVNNACFGAFDFPGVKFKGDRVITRAADDLAGVVIALGTVIDTKHRGRAIAVLTRAEEVGFIGCLAILEKKILNPKTAIVSLEASKTLDGAFIGEGPVLRLGDRTTLFHTDLSNQMWGIAQAMAKEKGSKFVFQRRIMDGGSCEATALGIYGFVTSGMSVPLGNYHNQGPHGPGPEMVSLKDIERARAFCTRLVEQYGSSGQWTRKYQSALEKELKHLKPKLRRPTLDIFERVP